MKLNERGKHIYWSLCYSDNVPEDMTDVRCVALSDGGYISILDTYHGVCHGISTELRGLLQRHQYKNLSLIATGAVHGGWGRYDESYYILKSNGKEFFHNVSLDFRETISECIRPKMVVLGGNGQYFIQEQSTQSNDCHWGGDINKSCLEILRRPGTQVVCIWIGKGDAYFLNYMERGERKRSYHIQSLPHCLIKYASNKRMDVRKMMYHYETGNFFVSYNHL